MGDEFGGVMKNRLGDIFTLTIRDRVKDCNDVSVCMSGRHLQEFVKQAQAMLDGTGPARADVGNMEARVFALANGGVELRVTMCPEGPR